MRIVCSPTPESLRILSVFVVFAMAAVALVQMWLRAFRRRDDSQIREMSVDSLRAPNLLLFTPLHRK